MYLLDASLRRISYFAPDGKFIRSQQISPTATGQRPHLPGALFPDGTGTAFVRQTVEQTTLWLRVDRNGKVRDTLLHYDRLLPAVTSTLGVIAGSPQHPGTPLHAHSADGQHVYIVDRPTATNPREAAFTVTRITLSGDTLWTRQHSYTPVPMPRSEYDALIDEGARRGMSPTQLRLLRPYAPYSNRVAAVLVAEGGELWVRPESSSDSGSVLWEVYNTLGVRIAAVEVPQGTRIMAARRDTLYAVVSDDLGVEYVVKYRLTR